MNRRNSCDWRSHRSMRRSRSRFCFCDAECQNTCSTNRLCSCDFHNRLWNIRRCGRMPFGYVDWKKNCSTIRSSCCGWRIRNPNRRSSGNRLRAGAARLNTAPSFHKNSCDRLRRWFRACSGRNRSYIPGSRFAYTLRPAHSPAPRCDCRSPGRSKNHTSRNRGLYTHKPLNFEHNDKDNIHNTADALWKCATEKRMFLAKSSFCSLGRCRQCRWTHGWKLAQALS